jgi:hypothetical protein
MKNGTGLGKVGFAIIFALGVVTGMFGFWLVIQSNAELHYLLLEQPVANSPQARIEKFVMAVSRKDSSSAAKVWETDGISPFSLQNDLVKRREKVISDLVAEGIRPDYLVLSVEWWTTCCEPSVTCSPQNAGGARINVQFLDKQGAPLRYVFDIFAREQPYWGEAAGYPPRDWVLRDVYPYEEKPLFWKLIHESENRSVDP